MDVLDKVLKAQPEVDLKADELEVKKMLEKGESHKTHTTHFKMTKTQITEVEQSESSEDELTNQENVVSDKKKRKGCFSKCFKRKKKP